MLKKYITVLFFLAVILIGNLPLARTVWAENLVQSTLETRLTVALRVGQAEVQKLVPAPWQVMPIPSGPLKDSNFFLNFIDSFLLQDPEGKPDMGGSIRSVAVSAFVKNTQTAQVASMVVGGFTANHSYVPGPYKNYVGATIRREQTHKGANLEAGVHEDFWEVRDTREGVIELRVQYQCGIPLRAKSETKVYSAVEPTFFRIYRIEAATDMFKSVPAGINRVKSYQLRVAIPELKNLFDGSEQLVAIYAHPLFVRQIFLP